MKKIYESPLNGWSESAERIYIYALENEDEYWKLVEMSHYELQEYFGMYEPCYEVRPGAMYSVYEFKITSDHVIIVEMVACNV